MNKYGSIPFEENLSKSIKANFVNPPKLVVGVSGGPDSMALLYGLYKLGIEVIGVHINYGLRGKNSDLDQELAEGMCFEWGFECCSISPDDHGPENENFQNWARKERYRIFRDLKAEYHADAIAIAHHKDDQIETILLKVFRGSGPETWQGMQVFDKDLFRPLLNLSKKEILEYCEQNSVPFRIDESNLESKYARNFLRNDLKKELDSFFPGWESNVLRLAAFGQLNSKAIEYITGSLSSGNKIVLLKFENLDDDLKTAVLKKFIEQNIEGVSLSAGLLTELLSLKNSQPGTTIRINDEIRMQRDRDSLVIQKEHQRDDEVYKIAESQLKDGHEAKGLIFSYSKRNGFSSGFLTIDADKLEYPLYLRRWDKGDRIQPLGMNGSQKISDHLVNRKVRSSDKEKALILSGADGTIYALIFPFAPGSGQLGTISEIVKCTEDTRMLLEIKYRHPE